MPRLAVTTPFAEHLRSSSGPLLRLLLAAALALAALDGGSFALESRHRLAILLWWGIGAAALLALAPLDRVPRAAAATLVLLGGFAVWTGASAAWAVGAERAVVELGRVSLYLGLAVAVVGASRRGGVRAWSDGLALGTFAVALLAVASRLFPGTLGQGDLLAEIAPSQTRLHYPVGYWNGLGVLVAVGAPLFLAASAAARRPIEAGAWLAPLPLVPAVIYLASSRGAAAVGAIGVVVLLALAPRRYAALGGALAAAGGGAAAVGVLLARPELVDRPQAVTSVDGWTAAALLAVACIGTAAAGGVMRLVRWPRPSRTAARATVAVAALALLVAALVLADPVDRFDRFRSPPSDAEGGTAASHFLSSSGTGRWQSWQAALEQFRSEPLHGDGAGSFAAWWTQNGSVTGITSEAHSLYLETLGELGLVGFALLVPALGLALVTGVRRAAADGDEARATGTAGVTAAYAAYLLGAGVDWMWELTVVSLLGIALLALLVGPATLEPAADEPTRWSRPARLALAAAAAVFLVATAIPFLREMQVRRSQEAVAEGRTGPAVDAALAAREIEPWAASPYLQLALVHERAGELGEAWRWIAGAIERDRSDWRLWLVRARIEARAGAVPEALESLRRARELNPRSPLFVTLFAEPG